MDGNPQVKIFKEIRTVMVMVDLAPDVWDEALNNLQRDLKNVS